MGKETPGGRLQTLGALLNTSLVGHSWATTDMEVTQKEGIHYGYFQPWSEIDSLNYFRMPWLQGDELLEMFKYYSQLRDSLIPYCITHKHKLFLVIPRWLGPGVVYF